MASAELDVVLARKRVRMAREIVARQEEIVAARKGQGLYAEDDAQTLALFRQSLKLFEDHLRYLTRPAGGVPHI